MKSNGAKRIVINGRFLTQSVTGVQRYARELVRAIDVLLDEHPELDVDLLTPRGARDIPRYRNINHRSVGMLRGHPWEQFDLPRFSKHARLFCPGNTAPVASLLGPDSVVVTVHDLSHRYFPEAYSRAFRLLYGALTPLILYKAAAVITVSESERASIAAHYKYSKVRLSAVQNGGLPEGSTAPAPNVDSADPYVLYVGSLSKRKNFPAMFDVACGLARTRGLRFVFVGRVPEGISDSLRTIPGNIRDRIEFAGQVDDWEKLASYYRSAQCFFFPSLYESSPLPPIEAMACGCPVIAGNIPSLTERCEGAALYCNPYSIEDMKAAVEAVVDDPALQNDLRQKGYEQAEKYSWRNCAVRTLEIILQQH